MVVIPALAAGFFILAGICVMIAAVFLWIATKFTALRIVAAILFLQGMALALVQIWGQ